MHGMIETKKTQKSQIRSAEKKSLSLIGKGGAKITSVGLKICLGKNISIIINFFSSPLWLKLYINRISFFKPSHQKAILFWQSPSLDHYNESHFTGTIFMISP